MARTASLSLPDATAACLAAYGPRGTDAGAKAITFDNRDHARRWLVAFGIPSIIARAASLAELKAAWRDDTNCEAFALARKAAPITSNTQDEETDMRMQDVPLPLARPAPPPPVRNGAQHIVMDTPAKAQNATGAAEHLAAALALLTQSQPMDAGAVRDIVAQELSGSLSTLQELQDATRKAIADMVANAPRALAITINDKPCGELPALRHAQTETLLQVCACRIPAYIVGPAGSGKTSAAAIVADALALPFFMQGAATGAHEFLGFIDAHGRYQTTPFRVAFENGGLFLADEIDGSDPAALLVLNAALANGHMAFPDAPEPVKRHADFRMVAAANTYGSGADRQYVGRNQLDAATLDRFAFIDWPYDAKLEAGMTDNADWLAFVQKVRMAVAKLSMRHVVSPRATIFGSQLIASGMARATVETLTVWKGLTDADVTRIKASI